MNSPDCSPVIHFLQFFVINLIRGLIRAVFTWLSKGIGFGFGFGFTTPFGWLVYLLWFWFYDSQVKTALKIKASPFGDQFVIFSYLLVYLMMYRSIIKIVSRKVMLVTLETFGVKCKFPCLSRIKMILKVRFIKAWLFRQIFCHRLQCL